MCVLYALQQSNASCLLLETIIFVLARTFDLMHCVIWGPYHTPTYGGHKYFLTLVDDNTRFTWRYLVKQKSQAPKGIMEFFSMVKSQFDTAITPFRSKNAKELALTNFFASQGTLNQCSCVQRPEQNSVVKRKHHHLLNVARALHFQSRVPIEFLRPPSLSMDSHPKPVTWGFSI